MTTTAERLRSFWGERQLDRGGLTSLVVRYWQVVLMIGIMGLATGLRLWHLDGRAIHHDESIHIKFAWDITQTGVDTYTHDPVYHGPFQYMAIATSFILFGDSDYTSRLPAALFGSAMVALPFLLRRQLGTAGAFAAALLIAVSPALLYVSRFAREDIYAAFFALGMVVCIWRFMEERKDGWLIAIAPLMALSFADKEITPITVATFIIFLNIMAATELVNQLRASRQLTQLETAAAYGVFVPTAWAIVALWPLLGDARRRWSLNEFPAVGPVLIIFGTLAAPQFAAGIQKFPGFEDKGYMSEPNLMHFTVFALIFLTAAAGLLWNPRIWLLAAACFYGPFVVLFTSFFTHGPGFWTGIWGSMDYWLSQQHVRRGDQPDYYYLMLLPVYEFLPLIIALGGALFYAFRGKLEQRLITLAALLLVLVFMLMPDSVPLLGTYHIQASFIVVIGAALIISMDTFTKFLVFWTLSALFALTVAGEKMPWLTIHIALPIALLAAKVLDDVISSIGVTLAEAEEAEEEPNLWDRVLPLLYGGVSAAAAVLLFISFGPSSTMSIFAWLLSLGAAGSVFWAGATMVRQASAPAPSSKKAAPPPPPTTGQLLATAARSMFSFRTMAGRAFWRGATPVIVAGLVGGLLIFTVRAAGYAAYDQGDANGYPREMLIYAQGSPALGIFMDEIDNLAAQSGQGHNLKIVVDTTGNIWPWPWYLRDYHNAEFKDLSNDFAPEADSIVMINSSNQAKMAEFSDQFQDGIPYTHMWWFPENYRGLKTDEFLQDMLSGHYNTTWRNYFIDRVVPGVSNSPDMLIYFPRDATLPPDITDVVTTPGSGTPLPADSVTVVGTSGSAPGQYTQPADLEVDAAGNLYIIDSLNHRFQRISVLGTIDVAGESGSEDGQFANPQDQSADFVADGPWGIAVDASGNIYVADTWNHKVQKFGPDLAFALEWGIGEFFGPRDIEVDSTGNLVITDTGNNRVVVYDPEGKLVRVIGKKGSKASEFNEPSGVAIGPNGDVYIADFWNQRIQHFDAQFNYIDEIKISSWGSKGITDRAYIAVAPDGHILATDPQSKRIIVFAADGTQQAAWSLPEASGQSRPIGIAIDPQGEQVYIADAAQSQIVRVPLAVLLGPAAPAATPGFTPPPT